MKDYIHYLEKLFKVSIKDAESVMEKFLLSIKNQCFEHVRNLAVEDAKVAKNLYLKEVKDLKDRKGLKDLTDPKDLKDLTDAVDKGIEVLSEQFSRDLKELDDLRGSRGLQYLTTEHVEAVLEKYRVALHDLRTASLKAADSVLAKYVRKP